MSRVLFLAIFSHVVTSISMGPAPTEHRLVGHQELAMIGMSPAPTPAPRRRHPANIFARQVGYTVGPETCGYNTEDFNDPVTCGSGSTCLFNSISDWFGCCSNKAACATIYTWCVPGSRVSTQFERSDTIYCTEGTSTECAMFKNVWERVDSTYTKYGCGSEEFTSVIYFDPTNGPGVSETTTFTLSDSSFIITTGSPTDIPPGPTIATPIPDDPDSNSTPIGAIVGGVIGGVAALAIIGFGVFLYIRRNKKAPTPPVQYSQPEYMGGQNHMPASMASPMVQHPPQSMGDHKSPAAVPTPMSPSPPYQQPYSPPPQTYYNPAAPNVSQLP